MTDEEKRLAIMAAHERALEEVAILNKLLTDWTPVVPPRPGPYADFESTDTTTQGTWMGHYGSEGHVIAGAQQSLPTWCSFRVFNQNAKSPVVLAADTTADLRTLQLSETKRSATCWFNNSFTIEANLTDDKEHDLCLYCLEYDREGRKQTVKVKNGGTNEVLDSRQLAGFGEGIWLCWKAKGHIQIEIIVDTPNSNALCSGLFLGHAAGHH